MEGLWGRTFRQCYDGTSVGFVIAHSLVFIITFLNSRSTVLTEAFRFDYVGPDSQ